MILKKTYYYTYDVRLLYKFIITNIKYKRVKKNGMKDLKLIVNWSFKI